MNAVGNRVSSKQKRVGMQQVLLGFMLLLASTTVVAQKQIQELNRGLNNSVKCDMPFSAVKPYLLDSTIFYPDLVGNNQGKLVKALFYGNWLEYNNSAEGIHITVAPLFNFEAGQDRSAGLYADTLLYTNSRGVKITGNLGSEISFYTTFTENQGRFANYIDSHIRETNASVGLGRVKGFKNTAWDYAQATGVLVYSPTKNLNFWFGNGKNFIGEGYRSLFLSDNAANYTNLKTSYTFGGGKFNYTLIYASLNDSKRYASFSSSEPSLLKKSATCSYLSYAVTPKLTLSFFESTVWQHNKQGREVTASFLQYNPVPLVNPIAQGLDAANNSQFGLAGKYQFNADCKVYSQLLLDGKAKQGVQLGANIRNVFALPLVFQVEFNQVSKNTYTYSDSLSNYTQLSQALAHPLGADFKELNFQINYRYKRLILDFNTVYAWVSNYGGAGQNVQKASQNQNSLENSYTLGFVQPSIAFLVNPSNNLQVKLGMNKRVLANQGNEQNTSYVYFSLVSALNNLYFDF